MGKKRQVCTSLDDELVKDMERIRDLTGLPVSLQIELRLKGYTICKNGARGSRVARTRNGQSRASRGGGQ